MSSKQTDQRDNLTGLQQWLQNAITCPWQTDQSELKQVVRKGPGNLEPEQRLGIYSRAYQGRLVECMESEFPVLRLALGTPLFVRFATEYLMAFPSQSYTLTSLGERFPEYLRQTRPENEDELWPEVIIELATLERLFSEVYHGQGLEKTDSQLSTESEKIILESGTRWMKCRFPVNAYFVAARRHLKDTDNFEPPEFPKPESMAVLIFRRDYVVQLRKIAIDALPNEGRPIGTTQMGPDT